MIIELKQPSKTELAAYVSQAIEQARVGAPSYEGSLDPTGSTVFYNRTSHEALEKYADLKALGWTLIHEIPVLTKGIFDFTARKPDDVFALDIPQISARAEASYLAGIERYNTQIERQQKDDAEILAEYERREAARKACVIEDIKASRRGSHHI
jgi:hypothetical protein